MVNIVYSLSLIINVNFINDYLDGIDMIFFFFSVI